MATIKDAHTPETDRTHIGTDSEALVRLEVIHARITGRQPAVAVLDRAEFIRAIETELDGTWIDGPLPEVTPLTDGLVECGADRYHTSYDHRADAMKRLAVARYLEANPPVDEAAVDALAKTLNDNDLGNRLARADLERLVQAGVRAPEETNKDGAR